MSNEQRRDEEARAQTSGGIRPNGAKGNMGKQNGQTAALAAAIARAEAAEAALAVALAPKPKASERVGSCECGCGAVVTGKARFQMGHDAKLKSALVATALSGDAEAEARLVGLGWVGFLWAARDRKAAKVAARLAAKAAADAKQAALAIETDARAEALAEAATAGK